jgi:hypothetical protein
VSEIGFFDFDISGWWVYSHCAMNRSVFLCRREDAGVAKRRSRVGCHVGMSQYVDDFALMQI